MRHEQFPPIADAHPFACDCPTCEPHRPSVPAFRDAADVTALWSLAGVLLGLAIVFALDHAAAARAIAGTLTQGWR